jgi:hypothetical protein
VFNAAAAFGDTFSKYPCCVAHSTVSTVFQARFIFSYVSFLSPRPPSPRSHANEACAVSSGVLALAPGAFSTFSGTDVLMSSSFSAVSFGVASVTVQFASSAVSVEFSPFAAPSSSNFFLLLSAICCIARAARLFRSTAMLQLLLPLVIIER